MTSPSLLLGILISTLCGLIFHLIFDGGIRRMAFYVGVGWVGFWAGHLLAAWRGWMFASIGPLNVGVAVLCSISLLGLFTALGFVQTSPSEPES